MFKFQIIVTLSFFLACGFQISDFNMIYPQINDINLNQKVVLNLKLGISDNGTVTQLWRDAIRYHLRYTNDSVSYIRKTLTDEEISWTNLIKSRISIWKGMIDSLRIPFKNVIPPNTVTILLGNQNGDDAFTYEDSTICFSLNRLYGIYGLASEVVNSNRIDRFFAHEFTHVLHKAWRKQNALTLNSPLDEALWACLTEGIGNYRKWIQKNGELTDHTKSVLQRLQSIFVQRISALEHATQEESVKLMKSLSMGPFDQKWGALTVALWLAQEAKGDDSNLQKWVDTGPSGILMLANKYLPDELKEQIPITIKN